MPFDEPGQQRAKPIRKPEPHHQLLLPNEPIPSKPLQMSRYLTRLAPSFNEPLPLLLRSIPIGPLCNERLGACCRPDNLANHLVMPLSLRHLLRNRHHEVGELARNAISIELVMSEIELLTVICHVGCSLVEGFAPSQAQHP